MSEERQSRKIVRKSKVVEPENKQCPICRLMLPSDTFVGDVCNTCYSVSISKPVKKKSKTQKNFENYAKYFNKPGVWCLLTFEFGTPLFEQTKKHLKKSGFRWSTKDKSWCYLIEETNHNAFISQFFHKEQWSHIDIWVSRHDKEDTSKECNLGELYYTVYVDNNGGYLGDVVYNEDIETILNTVATSVQ